MNFIREFINAALSGRQIGKGIKLTRQGKFEDALDHYKLAIAYESRSGAVPNPATREYLARTYARLDKLKEALETAEESYSLYKRLDSKNKLIVESLIRVERFIAAVKSENMDAINNLLTI